MLHVLHRADWGADPTTAGFSAPESQFVGLVLHHTVTNLPATDDIEKVKEHARYIQSIRPDLPGNQDGSPEWPYSFGVAEHTNLDSAWIVEGRGRGRTGAHTAGYNSTRYGIALMGDFTSRPMSPGMIKAVRYLGAVLLGTHTEATLGHRQTYATACPGTEAFGQIGRLQPPFTKHDISNGEPMMTQEQFTAMLAAATGGQVINGVVCVELHDAQGNPGWYPLAHAVAHTHANTNRIMAKPISNGPVFGSKIKGVLEGYITQ